MIEGLAGYKGTALEALSKAKVAVGDTIRVQKDGEMYEGILIPRSEFGDEKHIVIKLGNGYNIGIKVTQNTKIKRVGTGEKPAFSKPPLPKQKPDLPRVAILSTGGTIASRVDYRTGGVRPALSASDLHSVVPELSDIAIIDAEILFNVFSENLTPKHWSQIARNAAGHIRKRVAGVVIAHGTDTMGYTAAALSFALQDLPTPVILVGSQRSADRPSSDAATNLIGAVRGAAEAPFAEVAVAMHETNSDDSIIFHRGTKVRKCHTSSRDAFKSVNAPALARLKDGKFKMVAENYRKRDDERELTLKHKFNDKVALLKSYPDMNPRAIDWHVQNKFKGIVLEGTGLGHICKRCFPSVRKAIAQNVIVAMTSQCIWGRVNMNVYDTGRDLLEMGVVSLGDMLPETALVKMMWALGQAEDANQAKELLTKNVSAEFSDRTTLR